MTLFSLKTLALTWAGVAGVAVVSVGALQASYVAPPNPVAQTADPAQPVAAAQSVSLPAAAHPAVPFENRSLLAMLPPPDVRPHPAPHAAAPAEALPVPPIPPVRVVHADPPRHLAPRITPPEPVYAAEQPSYSGWDWGRRLPYPGQYASDRAYYYGGQPAYYGWQPQY